MYRAKDVTMRKIRMARGLEPVDLVLKGVRLVNVASGEIQEGIDIGIADGVFLGQGSFTGRETLDLAGLYVVPGLIDAHVHIESSMVTPESFWSYLLAHGVTTAVVDPHEIANVCGTQGLDYILRATAALPVNCFIALPSCVPSCPWESSGAVLNAADLAPFAAHPRVKALGEVMNVPAVLAGDPDMWAKLALPLDVRDGHAPGLAALDLNAYFLAGVGTDHECTTAAEATARLELGFKVLLREGSGAKNLLDLLPAVNEFNARNCLLATDDRHPDDLMSEGSIDHLIKQAIAAGQPPLRVIQMATINAAQAYSLPGLGMIAPGYQADFVVLSSLNDFVIQAVYQRGVAVSRNGSPATLETLPIPAGFSDTVHIPNWSRERLRVKKAGDADVIGIQKGQLWTDWLHCRLPKDGDGYLEADPANDIVKLAVIERHRGTGRVGVGFLSGLGLRRGALAATVAHDAHNLVVAGANDADMDMAVRVLAQCGGGVAVVADGALLGLLPLPVAGLMSPESLPVVAEKLRALRLAAVGLGVDPSTDPFMTLSFLSLPVIPRLKLTDRGLVDVEKNALVGGGK